MKITQNAVMVTTVENGKETVSRFLITDAASVAEYNRRHKALGQRPRSGYDKYFNDFGFTNHLSPRSLSAQGIGCLMASLMEHAYETIGRGGDDAIAMQNVLAAVDGYREIAAAEIANNKVQALAGEAAKLGLTPEKLAAFLAANAPNEIKPNTEVTDENETADDAETADAEVVGAN